MVIKEFLKLIITTIALPILVLFLMWIIFIGIHEGIWNSKQGEINPE